MPPVSQPFTPLHTLADADTAAATLAAEVRACARPGRTELQIRHARRLARRRYIRAHLKAARVELGAYDECMVQLLADEVEPRFIVAVLGWVLRSKGVNR